MPIQVPVTQTGLEASIQAAAQRAGRNLKIDLGVSSRSIGALSQPLGKITGQADQFTKSMEAANARVLAFGASVGVLSAVAQGFSQLVTVTIQVEKNMADINSVLQTNSANLNKFKNDIFSVAKETGNSFQTVSDAALELSRQGLKSDEVLRRLKDSMILSRLSGLDAASAVEGLTAAVNSFSKEGVTTSDVLNKISKTAAAFSVSERDLIEGFKRSASVAQQAGVSLDELGGIITAVQQKTARGGAVIGNAFKTIFTRIQRPGSLRALQEVGADITDAQNRILPATKLIENLAGKIKGLNDIEVANITEKIGGGFQVGPLIAALDDLNGKTSTFKDATEAMATANGEAYKRNIALNQTLAASINMATVNLQELANTLGEIGVTDSLKNILSFFNSFATNVKDVLQGEGLGSDFAKGLVKGISAVLSGPGLLLFGAIIAKLAINFVQFGAVALKTFFNIGSAAKEIGAIQSTIASTLLNNKSIQTQILALEGNRVAQAQFFSTALNTQLATMEKMRTIAASIAPVVYGATTGAGKPRAAGGYMPTVMAEANDIRKGVGGARPSDRPVVIPNFAFGGGKTGTMVAHTGEHVVPNYNGGSGSAIFNRDMVGRMGLPSDAQKIRGAGGFIPNFVDLSTFPTSNEPKVQKILDAIRVNQQARSGKTLDAWTGTNVKGEVTAEDLTEAKKLTRNWLTGKKEKVASSILSIDSSVIGGLGVASISEENDRKNPIKARATSFSADERTSLNIIMGGKAKGDAIESVEIPNIQIRTLSERSVGQQTNQAQFRQKILENFTEPTYRLASELGISMFPNDMAAVQTAFSGKNNSGKNNDKYLFSDSVIGGIFEAVVRTATSSISNIKSFNDTISNKPFDFEETGPAAEQFIKLFGFSTPLTKADGKKTATQASVSELVGKSLRDETISANMKEYVTKTNLAQGVPKVPGKASGYIPNFANQEYILSTLQRIKAGTSGFSKQEQETFLKKFGATGGTGKGISLKQVFDDLDSDPSVSPFINKAYGTAGATASTSQVFKEFERQIKANPTQLRNIVKGKGFIPNFANPLNEAISREIGAGVNPSQVYIDQNNSLKGPMNPSGLMVANRRDEPSGGWQGINRARKEGANAKTYGAAEGFIPNYALGIVGGTPVGVGIRSSAANPAASSEMEKPKRDFLGTIFAIQGGLTLLSGATEAATNSLAKYTNIISDGIGTATSVLFASQGLSSALPKFAGFLGPAGVAVSALTAAWQIGTSIYNEQSGINKIVAYSLSNVADAASKASVNLASLSKGDQSDVKKKAEASIIEALETNEMVSASQSNDFFTRFSALASRSGGSISGSSGTSPLETKVKQTARIDTDVTGALKQNLFDLQAEALGAGVPLEKLQGKIKEFTKDAVVSQFEIAQLSISFSDFIDEIKNTDIALKELTLNPLTGIGAGIAGMTTKDVKKFIDPQKNMTSEERQIMAGYSTGAGGSELYKKGQDGKPYAFTPEAEKAYNENPLKKLKDELKKTMGEGPALNQKLLEQATKLIDGLAAKTGEVADEVIAINQEYETLLLNLKAQQAFKDKIRELDDSSLNSQIVLQERITKIMNDQSLSEEDRLKAIKRLELSNKETLSNLKLQEQKLIDIQTLVNDLSKSKLFEFISTNPLMAEQLKSSFANATKDLSPEGIESLTKQQGLADLTSLARESLISSGIDDKDKGFGAKVGAAVIILKQTLDAQVQINREKEKENKLNRSNLTEEEKRLENTKALEKAFLKVKNAADIKNLSTSLTNIGLQGQSARIDIEKQMDLANPKTFAGVTDPREYLAIQQKIEFDAFERKRKLDLEIQVNQIKMEAEREATTIENITALGQNTEAINNWIDSQLTAQTNAAALAPLANVAGGGSINDIIAKQVKEQGLTSKFTNQEQNLKYLGSATATDENVIQLLKNLAYKESSFNPSTTYEENFNDSLGQPVISTGLFGISQESARGYGNSDATTENLKNPEYNTKVAVNILSELLTKSNGIIAQKTQGGYTGAAEYWSPFRKGASDTTSIDLSGQTEELRSAVSKQVEAISKLDPKQMQDAAEKFARGVYGAGDQASKFAGMISSKAGQIKEASASSQQNRETERQRLQAEGQKQAPKTFSQGMDAAFLNINGQLLNFSYEMGERIPQSFADNMASAMEGVIMQGESLGDSLRSAATSFLNEITKANIKNLASSFTGGIGGGIGTLFRANGGPITGGSGSKDDVPAMLMGGEYVMNKRAVSKYGSGFMEALNNGSVSGFADGGSVIRSRGLATDVINSSNVGDQTGEGGFQMPGYYGSGAITGKKDLLSYASQAYTSGAGDIIGGGDNSAYIDITPESVRLTNFGRSQGPMAAAVRESKEQSLDLYFQQLAAEKQAKEEEKAQKKAFKKAIINALITSAVGSVVGAGAAGFQAGVMGAGPNAGFMGSLGAGAKGIFTGGDIGGGIMAGGLKNLFSGNYQLSQTSDLKGYQQYLTSNPKELEKFLGGSASRSITGPNGVVLNAWLHAGTANSALRNIPTRATGGSIPQTSGIDTVPAMLSGGEFIMNAGATQRIGASNLNAMNSGASTETSSSAINDQLISKLDELIKITKESSKPVTVNVSSQQGQTGGDNQGEENKSEKDQNLSRKIKAAVIAVLQEEKRLGGVLRRS